MRFMHKEGLKRFFSIILAVCIGLSIPWAVTKTNLVYADQAAVVTAGVTNLNVRSAPSTSGEVLTKIHGGQALNVIETLSGWYKVSFTANGRSYTGYVSASYVTITQSSSGGSAPAAPSADGDFEAYLTAQGFPESYKVDLRTIHAAHPNWQFVAVRTGLDWNSVVENESNLRSTKNLVQGTSSNPHYNWRETAVGYNWATDTFSPYDGTTWFLASKDLVAYYLDPRSYLDERYVFAFEQLTYNANVHNAAGVETILAGSFMSNAVAPGDSRKYSQLIMEAGAATGVSPYHLAARIRQEVGSSASPQTQGTYPGYNGYYNYYNIGASDSAGGGATTKGMIYASTSGSYGRPWNSVYKAISGGAQFIGSGYILRGQDTLYTQKFNVTNAASLYSHQYISNVQATSTEAPKVYNAYSANNMLNQSLVFKIPVYNNMPETATRKPADSGSPNNWLRTLQVDGYGLTPTFTGGTTNYSLIVPNNVASVNISANAVNGNATISGKGNVGLNVGTNNVTVAVRAQNGNVRNYNICIVRRAADGTAAAPTTPSTPTNPTTPTAQFNTSYRISGSTIAGVAGGTNASAFAGALGANGSVQVYAADGTTANSGTVGTGNVVKVTNGATVNTYQVVVKGDLNGDGGTTILDLVMMKKNLLKQYEFSSAQAGAADINQDGSVTIVDLVMVKKNLLGQYQITP